MGKRMHNRLEGLYVNELTGQTYYVEATSQTNSAGIIATRFITQCGQQASAITLQDGRLGMILDDQTVLAPSKSD